jgi:hypothetical protein
MTKSRGINRPRAHWTAAELDVLVARYADTRTADLAAELGHTETAVYQRAYKLGLKKSEAFLASENSGRIQRGKQDPGMRASQFKPGLVPWNKGTKGAMGPMEGCKATWFKSGRPASEARNYQPVGSTRVSEDGYLQRKVTDDPALAPVRRWVAVHRLVWEAANGPIPPGHAVAFKPGRKTTDIDAITVDALELVSRGELMRRNSRHTQYPPEVNRLIQLRGALTRQINKRTKETS